MILNISLKVFLKLKNISVFRRLLVMGNQQSGAGGAGKDKGEQKEKKKYEPPVPTRVGKIILYSLKYLVISLQERNARR